MSRVTDNPIAAALPVLGRHEGVWDGIFRRIAANGDEVETFPVTIVIRYLSDGGYRQTNIYRPAGKPEQRIDTGGRLAEGRLRFDSLRVSGWSADDPTDPEARTANLYMLYAGPAGLAVHEQVIVSDCGTRRARTAHFTHPDGTLSHRTIIDEIKRSQSWVEFDGEAAA